MDRFARRSFGAVAFVLMLLRVVSPELGHQCAMDVTPTPVATVAHHAVSDQAQGGWAAAGSHGAHGAHHVHDAPMAPAEESAVAVPASHHAPADAPTGGCDCADWCCCLPTLADTPPPVVAVASTTLQQSRVVAASRIETPRAAAARLLPFATAPPTA